MRLGGLLTKLGTPNVSFIMAKEKIIYRLKDIGDWAEWWGVDFKFSDFFPFRSINIMRIIVAEPKTAKTLCKLKMV